MGTKDAIFIHVVRQGVQQAFFGFVSLRPASDTKYRAHVRTLVRDEVLALKLRIRGEQGEEIPPADVPALLEAALDDVKDFDPAAPGVVA